MKVRFLWLSTVLSILTLLSGSILSSSTIFADDSVVDIINITVSESCTMTGTGMNTHNAEIINGTYQANIGTTTLKAFCNDDGGFAIYAIGFTEDKYTGADHTKLIGAVNNQKIITGTATSAGNPDISNWAMKLATDSNATYPITLDNSYGSYSQVPDTYTKVAHRDSGTDVGTNATGAELTATYAAYISKTQVTDTYTGKVKYTLVHPSSETPLAPQPTQAGKICYYANGSNVEGTMGCQTISTSATNATLLASNFSRTGYGFAGWSTTFDYSDSTGFLGPQEYITFTAGEYTGNNPGLSLYAIWIKSEGNFQDSAKTASVCNGLTAASTSGTRTLASVSALTDTRDNQTYAIAKLADNKCWMIENLRLDNTAELTLANTNNPLNDGTNVTLKHNYTDANSYNTLSATSSVAYNADTAPDGWCKTNSAACDDQSRLRTDNIANRATYASGQTVSSQDANLYSYGNYYNWYSATAGNGTYSKSSGDVAGDLCPGGWSLPIGAHSTTDKSFGALSIALGGPAGGATANSSSTPTGTVMSEIFRAYPNNFIYSGYVNGGLVTRRGSYGTYWSSTAGSSGIAYFLRLDSSSVYPGTDGGGVYKYLGRSLRCLASSE